MFSIKNWTKELPTKSDVGKWFFIKNKIGNIYIRQIRFQEEIGDIGGIYVCPECHDGITKTSYGIHLSFYKENSIEFCGPIQMPPDYKIILDN